MLFFYFPGAKFIEGVNIVGSKQKSSLLAAWISLVSNIGLTGIKIGTGLLFHSPSLLSDGLHNAADVIASAAALGSMRVSAQPADQEHPYGHGKAQVIASGMVAMILAFASLIMMVKSIISLFQPAAEAHLAALAAALLSLVWKQILYIYTIRIGKKENSKSLIATAYDHLSDVYASGAAVVGIGLALLARYIPIHLAEYGDPLASVVVSLLIIKISVSMGKEAIDILMERNIPREQLADYEKQILSIPSVKRIDRIRAREHGHYILVDVRVSIPATLTVQEGHDITREIKKTLFEHDPSIQEVLVHVNPWYHSDQQHTIKSVY
jgi:cation diffusion facilitator family transporter